MDMAEDARRRGLDWPPPGDEINLFRGQGFQDILCTENTVRNHQEEAFKLRGVSGLQLFGNQCFGPGPGLTLDLAEDLQFGQNRMQGNRPHAVMIRDCGVSRIDASEFSGDRRGLVVLNPTVWRNASGVHEALQALRTFHGKQVTSCKTPEASVV